MNDTTDNDRPPSALTANTLTKRARLPGPDVVRAVAMFGVVLMNYHGYLIHAGGQRRGGWWYGFFDPWTGPLSTRFAATFVVTAGVGITLLTRRAVADPSLTAKVSWLLVRRGLLLYVFGLWFEYIWNGTILPFYGAMFVLAAVLWRLPSWALGFIGLSVAFAAWRIHLWIVADPESTAWLTSPKALSPKGLVYHLFITGTHPLLPWLAFLCAGIVVGRVLLYHQRFLPVVFAVGLALWVIAAALGLAGSSSADTDWQVNVSLSTRPLDRSMVYTASALGTALVAFTLINRLADRFASSAIVDGLRRAGQLSLTIYIGHALVFNLLVHWLGWVKPGGLATSLLFATSYWLFATAAGIAFQRRFGRGPAEWVYRQLTLS